MNNNFLLSFILATIKAKEGNIPEAKAKNIAITSSIGSLASNSKFPIGSLFVAKEMNTTVQENENLQTEVNNRISAKQIAIRADKILGLFLASTNNTEKQELMKRIAAAIGRGVFSDSQLKLLRKHSSEAIQNIIDVSLTIPDVPEQFPSTVESFLKTSTERPRKS